MNKKSQERRERIASLHGLEKAEYIWSYYKLQLIAAVLVLAGVVGIVKWAGTLKDETYLYLLAVNGSEEGVDIMDKFRKELGDTEEHHKYIIDTSVFFSESLEGKWELAPNAQMKLTTLVGAEAIDVMICPKSVYEQFSGEEKGLLYQVSELMGEEFAAKYSNICKKDAIRVEDSKVLKEYGMTADEPAYLLVFKYTKHPETAKEFMNFVLE